MEIKDYPKYLIYNDGRVYSKKTNIFMKPHSNEKGYLDYQLSGICKRKQFRVHRLVALHYIPNPDNKPEVDHIDQNIKNNNVNNLRWVTREEQMDNRSVTTNTGHKYIRIIYRNNIKHYIIEKKKCFKKSMTSNKYTLQDAINLRDTLLNI
tara:strand:+ start:57 stop:509 length:453 start_codon:yes stop_codon:yes gene_type:complete